MAINENIARKIKKKTSDNLELQKSLMTVLQNVEENKQGKRVLDKEIDNYLKNMPCE